ncbi:uncharacterized protein LOC144064228 [Stigmatopora argus]
MISYHPSRADLNSTRFTGATGRAFLLDKEKNDSYLGFEPHLPTWQSGKNDSFLGFEPHLPTWQSGKNDSQMGFEPHLPTWQSGKGTTTPRMATLYLDIIGNP